MIQQQMEIITDESPTIFLNKIQKNIYLPLQVKHLQLIVSGSEHKNLYQFQNSFQIFKTKETYLFILFSSKLSMKNHQNVENQSLFIRFVSGSKSLD